MPTKYLQTVQQTGRDKQFSNSPCQEKERVIKNNNKFYLSLGCAKLYLSNTYALPNRFSGVNI